MTDYVMTTSGLEALERSEQSVELRRGDQGASLQTSSRTLPSMAPLTTRTCPPATL